jgi:hypothetical protein
VLQQYTTPVRSKGLEAFVKTGSSSATTTGVNFQLDFLNRRNCESFLQQQRRRRRLGYWTVTTSAVETRRTHPESLSKRRQKWDFVTFCKILKKKNAKSWPISFLKKFRERLQNPRVFLPSFRRRGQDFRTKPHYSLPVWRFLNPKGSLYSCMH